MRLLYRLARSFGLDLRITVRALIAFPRFIRDYISYRRLEGQEQRERLRIYPVLTDYSSTAGSATGHYFHMDLWAARKIFHANPKRHVDVGSRIDGFVTHLLCFRQVEVVDIRFIDSAVPGLSFVQDNATELKMFASGSLESVSCLHAAEHFGLGRYGDPLDPHGTERLARSLTRVLAPGGMLYFAVPIGRERTEFNAHRVFRPCTVLGFFSDLSLVEFSAVDDRGNLKLFCDPDAFLNAEFACGLFQFVKR